jgi:hypothetical protein
VIRPLPLLEYGANSGLHLLRFHGRIRRNRQRGRYHVFLHHIDRLEQQENEPRVDLQSRWHLRLMGAGFMWYDKRIHAQLR